MIKFTDVLDLEVLLLQGTRKIFLILVVNTL